MSLPGSVLGLGLDLVELDRLSHLLDRHERRFLDRICRPGEVRPRRPRSAFVAHVGGLFAAKEAVLKALGTGWGQGLTFRDVEVVRAASGRPEVCLHGAAARRGRELGVERVHLSVTHERLHAAAVAVLEGSHVPSAAPTATSRRK